MKYCHADFTPRWKCSVATLVLDIKHWSLTNIIWIWDDHIDQVCSKLNKSLAFFQNCRDFINRRAAFNFYYNFFFCHLIYGIRIFGNLAPDYLLNRIFLLQKRAFRLIANVNHIPYHLIQTSDLQTYLVLNLLVNSHEFLVIMS